MDEAKEICIMRLAISPSPKTTTLPPDYQFALGKGTVLHTDSDAALFAYGPVMLNEAIVAADMLRERGFFLKVVNMPWLNRADVKWLEETVQGGRAIFVVVNHSPYGGLGDFLLNAAMGSDSLRNKRIIKFAVDDSSACGTLYEALAYHRLDGRSLAGQVLTAIPGTFS